MRKEAEALTPDEQKELADYLIARAKRAEAGKVDLQSLAGVLKLTVDPLEYQREIRSEWQ